MKRVPSAVALWLLGISLAGAAGDPPRPEQIGPPAGKPQTAAARRKIMLAPGRRDGWPVLRYHGPWFALDSSADRETTRRAVERMERVFRAYRRLLPPRTRPQRPLEIVLWGNQAQYHTFLARRRADMANPAFFSPEDNAVIAGLSLGPYVRDRRQIRLLRERVERELDQPAREPGEPSGDALRRFGLLPEGDPPFEGITRDLPTEAADRIRGELAAYEEQATAAFGRATEQTFAMLAHEAFHAYLENYVYPSRTHDLPRWLNEGLAQVFEHGVLRGDQLEIDVPAAELIGRLQADLQSAGPLALANLIEADHREFLVRHPTAADTSRRHYLYSWGVAHYLLNERHLLGTKAFEAYVRPAGAGRLSENRRGLAHFAVPWEQNVPVPFSADGFRIASESPRRRFEKLVGEPLDKFERKWQAYVLAERIEAPVPAGLPAAAPAELPVSRIPDVFLPRSLVPPPPAPAEAL